MIKAGSDLSGTVKASSKTGIVEFKTLLSGEWSLLVEKTGYQPHTQNFVLDPHIALKLDIKLVAVAKA